MSLIKLMLVDNNEVFKNGWRTLLQAQPEIEVVAETNSRAEAINILQTHHPDVVLMDITTVGMNEMEAIRQLKACCPTVDILPLVIHETVDHEKDLFFQMFKAGASGCIFSQAAAEDLLQAIRVVYCGEGYFTL